MASPLDWIDSLLALYSTLATRYPVVLTNPKAAERECEREFAELKAGFQREQPLRFARAWWDEQEAVLGGGVGAEAEWARLCRLSALLRALDGHFAARPLLPVPVGEEVRLVGRRWWRTYSVRPRAPHQVREPFPHLTRGQVKREEWVPKRATEEAFRQVLRDGELRVGLCALSGENGTAAETEFFATDILDQALGIHGVAASRVGPPPEVEGEPPSEVAEELRACLTWAREHGVHVLAFPELAVDEAGRAFLQREIDREPGSLCLVIPGSFHEELREGEASYRPESRRQYVNAAPVWRGGLEEDRTVARVVKTEPLKTKADPAKTGGAAAAHRAARDAGCGLIQEDICPSGQAPVIHTPVGTFVVLICRDALASEAQGPFPDFPDRCLRAADHVVVVSMNESPRGNFWARAADVGWRFDAATYYVNAAQSVQDLADATTDVAFWHLPYASISVRSLPAGGTAQARFFRATSPEGVALPLPGRVMVGIPLVGGARSRGGA